jgi:hypothetical protein
LLKAVEYNINMVKIYYRSAGAKTNTKAISKDGFIQKYATIYKYS